MMTYIRTSPDELATVVQEEKRSNRESASHSTRPEIGRSLVGIAVSVLVMTVLIVLRLWFLMPGSFHFAS